MVDEQATGRRSAAQKEEEFVPSEEQILRELKQREKRKQYMNTPKAKENRKKYMQKRYVETKTTREAIKNLQDSDPDKYAQLMAQAQASIKK